MVVSAMPGQIWRDDCYYRDHMGECQPHFVLILAVCQQHNDAVTVTFTSKPNGLTVTPPCSSGPPRAGYFVGMPGGKLHKESWADLQSIDILDHRDFCLHVGQKRKSLEDLQLPPDVFARYSDAHSRYRTTSRSGSAACSLILRRIYAAHDQLCDKPVNQASP